MNMHTLEDVRHRLNNPPPSGARMVGLYLHGAGCVTFCLVGGIVAIWDSLKVIATGCGF